MSKSKFLNIQEDICIKPEKPPEPDRICASCVPDPSFIPPDWWTQPDPWLNEQTCEYSVAVTINEDGRAFRLSDLRNAFEAVRAGLDEYKDISFDEDSLIANNPMGPEAGLFEFIKRTYKKPGIRKMIRHYGKYESDAIICAAINVETEDTPLSAIAKMAFLVGIASAPIAVLGPAALLWMGATAGTAALVDLIKGGSTSINRCSGEEETEYVGDLILDGINDLVNDVGLVFGAEQLASCANLANLDYSEFIKVRAQLTSFNNNQQYETYDIEEKVKEKFCEIENLNALELYTRVADYHFHGVADNAMSVLITIPAHIFDQIPEAPDLGEPDTSIETLSLDITHFTTYISQMKKTFSVFSKFQSAFYQNENGKLLQQVPLESPITEETEEGEEQEVETSDVPFYLKGFPDRFEEFEDKLALFIEEKGYGYPGGDIFSQMRGMLNLESDVIEIEIKFDKSDPNRPYKLAEKMRVKPKSCDWVELTLPKLPENPAESSDNISSFAYRNQTLMGYIAQYEKIKTQINARETPPWLDFIVENTFPPLIVNYGTSEMFHDKSAVNCLADKLSGVDDFILNEALSFGKAFQYQMNKNSCKLMKNLYNDEPVLYDNLKGKETKKKKKLKKEQKRKKVNKSSTAKEIKKTTKKAKGGKMPKASLKDTLSKLDPCNWKAVTMKAISCLLGEMTVEDGYRAIIKSTLGNVSSAGLGLVIEGLPQDKQDKIREQVEKSFKDMPAPWESGWESGDLGAAVDRTVMDNIAAEALPLSEIQKTYDDINKRLEKIEERLEKINQSSYITNTAADRLAGIPDTTEIQSLKDRINWLESGSGYDLQRLNQADSLFAETFSTNSDAAKTAPQMGGIPKNNETPYTIGMAESSLTVLNQETTNANNWFRRDEQKFREYTIINEQNMEEFDSWPCKKTVETVNGVEEYDSRCFDNAITEEAYYSALPHIKEAEQNMELWKSVVEENAGKIKKIEQYISLAKNIHGGLQSDLNKKDLEIGKQGYITNEQGIVDIEASAFRMEYMIEKERDKEILDLNAEKEALKTQSAEMMADSFAAIKKSPELSMWESYDDETKDKLIEREKEKTTLISLNEKDKIKQGTLGRALGDVQKAVFDAYTSAIMESADVRELMNAIDKLPGAKIIGDFISSFDCPRSSLIYPPIDSFLNTLTADPCGPGKTRFALPEIKKYPQKWNVFPVFADAFVYALKKSFSSIMSALILKQAAVIEASACRAVEGAKKAGLGVIDGTGTGLNSIIDEMVCKEAPDADKDEAAMNLFTATGVPQRSPATARELLDTMSVLGTEDDFKKAMLLPSDEQDRNFLNNLARTITAVHPEYVDFLGDADKMGQFLQGCGGMLTEDQADTILNEIDSPTPNFPLESSICLTKEEAERYDEELQTFYSEYVGPEIAEEFVNKQKDKKKSDLGDLVDALLKAPDDIFTDTINRALAHPDPDCANNQSAVPISEEAQERVQGAAANIFVPLKKAFADDTLEENFFETALGFDSVGIMLTLLSDSVGYNLAMHNRIRTNLIFRAMAWIGIFDAQAGFPDTIGRYMREYILNDLKKQKYDHGKIKWHFSDDIRDDDGKHIGFRSSQVLEENYMISSTSGSIWHNDFNYKFYQWTPDFAISNNNTGGPIIIERPITEEEKQELIPYEPIVDELLSENGNKNQYKYLIFRNILQESYSPVSDVEMDVSVSAKILNNMNNIFFTDFCDTILRNEDGGIPQGFLHGGNVGTITLDDLTYVDPEPGSTEYTFNEEERVLGRSMTNNPRVKFLDPDKYGGSYEVPNIYVDPVETSGWMRMSKMIVPNIAGCDPLASNFLRLEELEKFIGEREPVIEKKEELSKSPECFTEVPFDKVSAPATLASLEAVVYATIRVFVTELAIFSLPVHSAIRLSEENYDELLAEYIVNKMEQSMSREGGWFVSTYEKYTYWLLFLEQAVQTYDRKVKLGEIKPDVEAMDILEQIRTAQMDYTQPTFSTINEIRYGEDDDSWGIDPKFTFVQQVQGGIDDFVSQMEPVFGKAGAEMMAGAWIIGKNTNKWNQKLNEEIAEKADSKEPFIITGLNALFMTLSMARLGSKVTFIIRHEEHCRRLLNRLVMDQIKYYGEIIKKEMTPRPLAYDVFKFFIGGSKTTLGETCRAGLYDIEVPIGEGSEPRELSPEEYGTINNCSPDGNIHPLQSWFNSIDLPDTPSGHNFLQSAFSSMSNFLQAKKKQSLIKGEGGFYLEKYLRIIDKNLDQRNQDKDHLDMIQNKSLGSQIEPPPPPSYNETVPPEWIENRPSVLKDVVNIESFKKFLRLNENELDPEMNISDYFGDAHQTQKDVDVRRYSGSTGIKFGVRVCYIPSKEEIRDYNPFGDIDEKFKFESTIPEKSHYFMPLDQGLRHTKFSFPLVSYEQDIHDVKLVDLINSNENLDQDLKCYIDNLVEHPKFKIIFDKILNIRKIPSFLACYSAANFFASLGLYQGIGGDDDPTSERRSEELGWLIEWFDQDPPASPSSDDRGNVFNDCKSQARKIFTSVYKRNDFDPPDEDSSFDFSLIMQKLMAQTYNLLELDETIPWWYRRRIVNSKTNPKDKEGNECENQFGKLFGSRE